MYHHIKKLMFTVQVGQPDPRFGNMLLEQFGGANGELAAAMQYSIQGINCDHMACKDLLMDIGTEELSHLEVIGTLARMHMKPMKKDAAAAEHDPLVAIAGGCGVTLCNSMGNAWTSDYLKVTGELDVDLRSNIAAEARAKIVYERLIDYCDDPGTKQALQFLMTREITHMRAFMQALDSLEKPALSIGRIPPTPGIVDHYYNDSTGEGDDGETDVTAVWNSGPGITVVESPALAGYQVTEATPDGGATTLGSKSETPPDDSSSAPRPAKNASQTGSAKSRKPPAEKPSAAAQQLGGQPENDEDARAAGLASATAPGTARKPRKTKTT